MKFEFDPEILFPDIWFKNASFSNLQKYIPQKKVRFYTLVIWQKRNYFH